MASIPPAAHKVLRFWEWPFVAALAAFMFWVRMIPYKALVGGERAYYIGTDPFYHYRAVLGIVEAFPRVPRWDPWTHYPYGTGTGQFGSLFDWVITLAAIVTGGGAPDDLHIQRVLGIAPAILGALIIVPFYFLAKRMLGTAGAVIASLTLAVLPGEFLIRSIAGYADHHVAEALMAVVSVLAMVVAAERSHKAREKLVDLRDVKAYRGPLAWSLLAGVALAGYYYVWPPAILFLAIMGLWLGIVILLENAAGRSSRGFAFAGAVAFTTAGLLMAPAVETMFLGEFNTYGLMHVVASIGVALGIVGVHKSAKLLRMRGTPVWVLPASLVALGLVAFFVLRAVAPETYRSVLWGLSWITGIGVQRTTMTIAEARSARFLCDADAQTYSCVGNDFGLTGALFVFLLVALAIWTLWKRRRMDILLLIWSFVMYRATTTQIRFSYYVALNIALLMGWLAARISYASGLERDEETRAAEPSRVVKGRKTRRVESDAKEGTWMKVGAVALVAILILPGNVFGLQNGSSPGWESVGIRGPDGDLVTWMESLDWMRANTPDAGMNLGLVVPRPAHGETFDYPPEAYGVLSWWDYGHWIQTVGLRPPVANPFQQAAPFASLYFTERDPAQAERMLDEWASGCWNLSACEPDPGNGPVRYVMIDDGMATGKYGAITVWANSQNESRARYAGGDYIVRKPYEMPGSGQTELPTIGPGYENAMMGRLYDADGRGLSNYRLVYEHPNYRALGTVFNTETGNLECLHDIMPSRGCWIFLQSEQVTNYQPGTAVHLGGPSYAYDLQIVSPLKIFERVEGARLTGTAQPGELVRAGVVLEVRQPDESTRRFQHVVDARADDTGAFEIVFPYATTDLLTPEQGGTDSLVKATSAVQVQSEGGRNVDVQVPDRAVLEGQLIAVEW